VALKLKLNKRQITIGLVVALALIALLVSRAGRDGGTDTPGTLDDWARQACDDFAAGYPKARTDTTRLALADKVVASSARTDNDAIGKRAAEMGHAADEGNAAWKRSATALTTACRNAGWTAA
jgi:predicted transcriptional regulator